MLWACKRGLCAAVCASILLSAVSARALPCKIDAASPGTFAEAELVSHLNLVFGADSQPGGLCIALGRRAPGACEPEAFTSYGRRVGDTVYLWGDDSRESAGAQERPGTLFAVYGFLESVLGMKWVSPGDFGIVCRSWKTLDVPADWEWRYSPPLMMGLIRTPPKRELRHAKEPGRNKYLPSAMRQTAEEAWRMEQDFRIWALRMKLWVKGRDWSFGHAFVNWNERYLNSHPEYLAMQENGERGTKDRKWHTRHWMKLCVSNEATIDRILDDWKAKGRLRHLNICQNDGLGLHCRCDGCRAMDTPLSSSEPFGVHVTDRYLGFANRVAAKARLIRPDVQVCCYAYQEYRYPPRREKVQWPDNIVVGMVPSYEDDVAAIVDGWKRAGLKRFTLRPNFLFYHGVLPRGFERDFFGNLKSCIAAGVMGCDYDCNVRGGVTDFEKYAVARALSNPEVDFASVEAEFLSQYGAAASVMGEYYRRIRERGEAALAVVRLRGADPEEAGVDDSCRRLTVFGANPRSALEGDLDLLKSAATVPGLSNAERVRVDRCVLACEHALRTRDFLVARDEMPRKEFVKVAFDLIDYRIEICRRLPDSWGAVFRGFKDEVRWWRFIAPEVKAKFPEMELAD